MDTTNDGRSVVLGMGDGSMTTLTIADPAKEGTKVVFLFAQMIYFYIYKERIRFIFYTPFLEIFQWKTSRKSQR